MELKQLTEDQIKNARLLYSLEDDLLIELLKSFNATNFDILPIFDLDFIFKIAGVNNAEDYLSPRGQFKDIDLRDLYRCIAGVEDEYSKTSLENEAYSISNDIESNLRVFEDIESNLRNLLELSCESSPEDVIYMNEKVKTYWEKCF